MKTRNFVVLALTISISTASAQTTELKLTPALMKKFQAEIAHRLKDPDSVKFRGVVAAKTSDGFHAFCGRINSKNSFGGYTGERIFIGGYDRTGADIVISDGTRFVDEGLLDKCAKYGLYPR